MGNEFVFLSNITRHKRIKKRKYTEEKNQGRFGGAAVANKWEMIFSLSNIVNFIIKNKRVQKRKYKKIRVGLARLQLPTSNILPLASANYFPQVLLLSFFLATWYQQLYFTTGLCKLFPLSFAFIFFRLNMISANSFTPAYYSCLVFSNLFFLHKILLNLDRCPPKKQLKCLPCHLKFSFDLGVA